MIYTVTLNPSLDYVVTVAEFRPGAVNRAIEEKVFPGGKGINVSIVLSHFGLENIALGFSAGFTGRQIECEVRKTGCRADFITVRQGLSRINVKLRSRQETEINGQGPQIEQADFQKLIEKLEQLKPGDVLVLAGSIPGTMPDDTYEVLLKKLQGKNILVVVDATRDLLLKVLPYHPFFIKPNQHELGEIFGRELRKTDEIVFCARQLQKQGAQNVLVSMAGEGAVLVTQDGKTYLGTAPQGEVRNSVGAGDSMVAGFIAGYMESQSLLQAFRTGIAAGSASAFSEELAEREKAESLLPYVTVVRYSEQIDSSKK